MTLKHPAAPVPGQKEDAMKDGPSGKHRIVIIGMGKGGAKLAQIFSEDPTIEIVGVSNRNQAVPGMIWAGERGIHTTPDYKELFKIPGIEIVIDASGNEEVARFLKTLRGRVEVVSGITANLVWRVVDEREERERESGKNLRGLKRLYDIGLRLANADKSESALRLIIESGMEILGMEAGSTALFDEKKGTMKTTVSIGFRKKNLENMVWEVRQGGITSAILSNRGPTVVENVNDPHPFDTGRLKENGIGSLIAVPLVADGKIVGILYVDDFRPRKFTVDEVNHMNLLGTLAASAVDKIIMLERAEELAMTDELTKVYNHRYFTRMLSSELKRAGRYGEHLGLIMIDVDHFKHFNDTNGHLEGNDVLVMVAGLLKQCSRETDVVARYGGEEFAVIMPKTNRQQTARLAERLRTAVENHPFPGGEKQPGGKLTISLGAAVFPDDWNKPDEPLSFLGLADSALYKSKHLGRNRVTMWGK
ncbi:MAG: diguanylate cyclase [Nitrospinae bacterium]|nr:diguanylate cyclase [Nitrospinota bacterium]